MHENQNPPPSLSQNGCLNTGTKSDLMGILQTGITLPDADSIIIDGAALIGFQSFRTQVISYPSHFVPFWSFRTHFYFHFGHFVPSLVISYQVWSFRTYFYVFT